MSIESASTPAFTPAPLLVACLCAAWCGTCTDYQPLFVQLQAAFPGSHFVWVDIEDESDLVDPIEVDNFPTLLIASREHALFFGTMLPHIQNLQRLIETQMTAHQAGDARALPADDDVAALVGKLWQRAEAR